MMQAGRRKSPVFLIGNYALMFAFAAIFILPLLFMGFSSLKPNDQLLSDATSIRAFLPVGDLSLENYTAAFARAPIATFIFNSVVVTGVTVFLALLLGAGVWIAVACRLRFYVFELARQGRSLLDHSRHAHYSV